MNRRGENAPQTEPIIKIMQDCKIGHHRCQSPMSKTSYNKNRLEMIGPSHVNRVNTRHIEAL